MWSVWVIHTNYQASPKKKTDFFSRGGVKPQNFFSDFLAFFCGATAPPCTRSPAQLVALPFCGFGSVRTRTSAPELCATFPKRKKECYRLEHLLLNPSNPHKLQTKPSIPTPRNPNKINALQISLKKT